jgi:hydrogenase small subunit
MADAPTNLEKRLAQRGVSRRSFLKFCALMGATLAMPASFVPKIAEALSTNAVRPPLLWLEFQDCTGDSESFLRASNPNVAQILLETVSVNYHETLMVPSGQLATKSLNDTIAQYPGQYLVVVEGSIPTGANGAYCAIGGRRAVDIVRDVCSKAAATISVGSCSGSGGWPAAAPNPTGAAGVKQIIPGLTNYVNLPGCPVNVVNLAAVITSYLTNHALPACDAQNRPLFAYGYLIHDQCERRPHYDAGEFVRQWGDAGHKAGWCLAKMGCRGPETRSNCPAVKWNGGTSWPVGSGHPCIGCTTANFWDTESPFYVPLPA